MTTMLLAIAMVMTTAMMKMVMMMQAGNAYQQRFGSFGHLLYLARQPLKKVKKLDIETGSRSDPTCRSCRHVQCFRWVTRRTLLAAGVLILLMSYVTLSMVIT